MSKSISSEFLSNPNWTIFNEPNLRFLDSSHDDIEFPVEGIQKLGPYDLNSQKRKFDVIDFVVLQPENGIDGSNTQKLLATLLDGTGYYNGFKEEFRLAGEPQVKLIEFESTEQRALENLSEALDDVRARIRTSPISNRRPLVFVAGQDYKAISNTKQYYLTKRILLRAGIPNQYLSSYEGSAGKGILQQTDDARSFVYSVWNVALAAYAKAGGIPWILKSSSFESEDVDCVIGIRFARDRSEEGYVIGTVSVFGKYGSFYGVKAQRFADATSEGETWIAKSRSACITEEDSYSLGGLILERHKEKTGELPRHIVIQRLGPYHEDEVQGFSQRFEEAGLQKFCFLEIYTHSNYRIFKEGKYGISNVRRGLALQLNRESALLCTTGDSHYTFRGPKVSKHQKGTPKPIVVRIRAGKNSLRNPMTAARNVFTLTGLHWGCGWSKEIQLPVPLNFAQKVGRLFANGVRPHDSLSDTAWFL